jgi:nucleoside-diphosphate-sugar epimerase
MNFALHNDPIFITGAGGFLGNRMVELFQSQYREIRALLFSGETRSPSWADNVKVFYGDVTKIETLRAPMKGIKQVFHHAAMVGDWGSEAIFHAVGVNGTENIIQLALEENAHLLLTSSIVVNGADIGKGARHEKLPYGKPLGVYSRTKQKQEQVAIYAHMQDGLKLTVIRPGNVTGAGSQPWVNETVSQMQKSLPILIGGGMHKSGLCNVDNVVEVFRLAALNPIAIGKVYNALDSCAEITWKQYFQDLARIAQTPAPKSISVTLAKMMATFGEWTWETLRMKGRPPLTHDALNLVGQTTEFSLKKANDELGYQPVVTYQETLDQIKQYLKT